MKGARFRVIHINQQIERITIRPTGVESNDVWVQGGRTC